jgi:hypothetical protein
MLQLLRTVAQGAVVVGTIVVSLFELADLLSRKDE